MQIVDTIEVYEILYNVRMNLRVGNLKSGQYTAD